MTKMPKDLDLITDIGCALGALGFTGVTTALSIDADVLEVTITVEQPAMAMQYYLTTREEVREVRALSGLRQYVHTEWVADVIVQADSHNHWEPAYEDSVELATGPSPIACVIEAVLAEFNQRMFNALPVDFGPLLDIEEDIPQ